MRYTKSEIGAILRTSRLGAGLTQKEVALAIGRTQQIVGHWETGYSQPDADTLFVLCDLYGVSIDAAFGFSPSSSSLSPDARRIGRLYDLADDRDQQTVESVLGRYDEDKKGVPDAKNGEKSAG